MILTYSWAERRGGLEPLCTSTSVNGDGVSLISCLLTDDGGLSHASTISWLKIGIETVNGVLFEQTESGTWDRETFGANILKDNTEIYSLHVEDYNEFMSTKSFQIALCEWNKFIQSIPDTEKTLTLDL